jgi:hypothetical protein
MQAGITIGLCYFYTIEAVEQAFYSSYSYQSSSRLFQPYRTLGIITSGKGFYVQSADTFIKTLLALLFTI